MDRKVTPPISPPGKAALERSPHPASAHAEAWVDEHGDVLFRYALWRVRDRHVAEDLVQETFLAALRSSQSFRGESSERTWLIGILRHKVVDHQRKDGRESPLAELADSDSELDAQFGKRGGWKTRPGDWRVDPEALLERAEFWAVFDDCLEALPPRLAEAFSLRVMAEVETDEVCKVLGITSTNIWVILHRARGRLRACLEANWFLRGPDRVD